MEKNIKKVRKTTINGRFNTAVKRGRTHRFAKWCSKMYGISWRGIYENLRSSPPPKWKWEGMENCIKEFKPEHKGSLRKFWKSCKKNQFVDFMKDKDICRATLWKKFKENKWTALERKGIKYMYQYWLENIDLKNK